MNYSITIKANNSPELLERLLRVTRHRGFAVENIRGEAIEDDKLFHLTLTVSSERPIPLLSKQLEKLFGVIEVSTATQAQAIKAIA